MWRPQLADPADELVLEAAVNGRASAIVTHNVPDSLKAWGDVLVKQSKIKEALAKYDETLKHAPNWKQLKESREATAR
jgi:hypothetical protein